MAALAHKSGEAGVAARDVGLLLIRLMLAVVLIYHGSQKLFGWFGGPGLSGAAEFMGSQGIPLPMVAAVLSSCTEFFGALILLIGTGTRIAAIPMSFNMFVASFVVHWGAFDARNQGMEYPLTLAVVLAGLALTGPGRLAVWRRRRRPVREESES